MLKLFFGRPRRDASPDEATEPADPTAPRYGEWLAAWLAVLVLAHASLWVSGHRQRTLERAVEQGVARVERWAEAEDLKESQIRQAIRTQRETLPFWETLWLLADFLLEPAGLVLRAVLATVVLASLAALMGRPPAFGQALAANVRFQVFWVVAVVVQALLANAQLGSGDTSLALLAPPAEYPASVWLTLKQLDLYALAGWFAIGLTAWRRRQAHPVVAALAVGALAAMEIALRVAVLIMIGASMRLTIFPD